MFRGLIKRLALLRPRTIARLTAQVAQLVAKQRALSARMKAGAVRGHNRARAIEDHLTRERTERREQARVLDASLASLRDELSDTSRQLAALSTAVAALAGRAGGTDREVATVRLKCDQLAVSAERLSTDVDRTADLARVTDSARVRAHVSTAVAGSQLCLDPFPHLVIDNFLPDDLYDALIETMPPRVLFEDNPVNRQQLKVPPRLAGAASFRLWRFLVNDIVEGELQSALVRIFREPITEFAHRFWPGLDIDNVRFKGSDGRIILRRRGYVIPPHRDPKWGWLTFILYLAKPGDPDTWGTQLYRVTDDVEAPGAQPFWMQAHNNVLVRDVRFVPNRALAFLNSDGSHGASLPPEAPADFERYIYQCRVGPDRNTIERLKAVLTPEARARWEGKDGY